ncbi:hypothetical protein V5P93_006788 [Actinokineospora auranticolor]|uniref:Outer membrane channel protein CpnT-like N-terminal domain-containing protein n=1 Tax=Actinokineospora auranticolor TaxID=155976 RepID=A0A2S6GWI9_9PSEU|nr:hypothetical protein [Actinokineospora auranticolor]PPK69567.1 hypothetical protein CLV40_103177 [Actinokineospora auranticolor]
MTDTETGLSATIEQLSSTISSGNWADLDLNTGIEALGYLANPVDALVSSGVQWVLEHVQPLRDALNEFAGDPGAIQAYAEHWREQGRAATESAVDLKNYVQTDTSGWTGETGDAYRAQAAEQVDGLLASGAAAKSVANAVEAAGLVVAAVRLIVQELIAELVKIILKRIPIWLAATGVTLGIGTVAVVADLLALIAEWV